MAAAAAAGADQYQTILKIKLADTKNREKNIDAALGYITDTIYTSIIANKSASSISAYIPRESFSYESKGYGIMEPKQYYWTVPIVGYKEAGPFGGQILLDADGNLVIDSVFLKLTDNLVGRLLSIKELKAEILLDPSKKGGARRHHRKHRSTRRTQSKRRSTQRRRRHH